MKGSFNLSKSNITFSLVLLILYIIGFILFSEKSSYQTGYYFGSLFFLLGFSLLISFFAWLFSGRNRKIANGGFTITLIILLIIKVLNFLSKLGQSVSNNPSI